jgi:hypothetical protein
MKTELETLYEDAEAIRDLAADIPAAIDRMILALQNAKRREAALIGMIAKLQTTIVDMTALLSSTASGDDEPVLSFKTSDDAEEAPVEEHT